MQPNFSHTNFFTSLKQVEKRLKLETPSPQQQQQTTDTTTNQQNQSLQQQKNTDTQTQQTNQTTQSQQNQSLQQENDIDTQTQSLSTPLYLNHPNPNPTPTLTPTSNFQESEPPQEFFSNSIHFSATQENPCPSNHAQDQERVFIDEASDVNDDDDDIELLMQLLGLKDDDEEQKRVGFGCDERFYGKVVGVKGPKSDEEVERLNKWIKHFLNKGEGSDGVKQPLRLAHLLLAKAAFVHSEYSGDDFDGFEFPSTIYEFLQHDPPVVD